jgi:hypothetical protein
MVLRTGGELRIQSRDGRWRESFAVGRDSFKKISAVEGISTSRVAERTFREFDRRGLSADQRRDEIVSRYGKER